MMGREPTCVECGAPIRVEVDLHVCDRCEAGREATACAFDGGKCERYWSVVHEVYVCNKCGQESGREATAVTDPRPALYEAIRLLQQIAEDCSYSVHWAPMSGWEDIVARRLPEVQAVLAPLTPESPPARETS